MKKLAFMLFCSLAVAAGSCGDKKAPATVAGSDAIAPEPFEATTNIRYVVQDSIQSNYVFAQTVQQAVEKLEYEYMAYANQLDTQLQNMQADFQRKLQNNGYLTEASAQADANKLQSTAASYQRLAQQRRAEINEEQRKHMQALQDSINNFLVVFNREHKYDAILYKETCLYLNPQLDITAEVVDGLNKAYKGIAAAPAPADTTATAPAAKK